MQRYSPRSRSPHDSLVVRLKHEAHEETEPEFFSSDPPPVRPRVSRRKFFFPAAIGALLIVIALSSYFLWRAFQNDTQVVNDDDVIAKVGTLIRLPNEVPTIATVSDLAPLNDQLFFEHAEVGDIVLMFPQAAKAILYSPRENKIIEVAPITRDVQ